MLLVFAASFSVAQSRVTEKEAVAYAKAIDVKNLDSSLASQGLEDWLRSGTPHAEFLRWTLDYTCDLKPDDSNTDYPLCVKIELGRGGQYGHFLVEIGTDRQGIVGAPSLYSGVGVFEKIFVITGSGERLSDLPSLLDQPVVTTRVQDLFAEIVAHPPIGVPKGAEKTAIWPLLSKR